MARKILDCGDYKATIQGVAGLIMHNGDLRNPNNEWAKIISEVNKTKEKQLTETQILERAHAEFMGGLYVNNEGQPIIPGEAMEATLCNAAKKHRRGKDALAALWCPGDFPLIYDGPQNGKGTAELLFEDQKFHYFKGVRIGQQRVMRLRPIFLKWSAKIHVCYSPDVLNQKDVEDWLEIGGRLIGLLDYRPKFGRFIVV